MTLSVLMYVLMTATFVALAGVLAFDAVTAVLRRSAQREADRAGPVHRRSSDSGARSRRAAPTGT
ncbi:MAG: hypothetical protein QOI64_2260 [Solirubrobacteraceae bacterium]|jgi:hypothetical protein|nr:hypothetical protein [Solirubrobacteraceae bacterium]